MRSFALAAIALCLVAYAPALTQPAHANGLVVNVTSCETVEVAGQSAFRLTLAIAGQLQFYDTAVIGPPEFGYPNTCTILAATPPDDWFAFLDEGRVLFYGSAVNQGELLDGFQITLSDPSCCKFVSLSNVLLFDSPGFGNVCFHDCAATPANLSSWGSIKSVYR
jgi:hypothetical protein